MLVLYVDGVSLGMVFFSSFMSFSRIFGFVFPFEITFAVIILNLLRYFRLKFGFVEDSANEIYSYTDNITMSRICGATFSAIVFSHLMPFGKWNCGHTFELSHFL